MTTANLKNRLSKKNIVFAEKSYNYLNKSIIFTINNTKFEADFDSNKNEITCYSTDYGFNPLNEERNRHFFYSFNQVVRYANN